ncbi:MAG: PKD domain-containing protein [Cytophagaceae bacterium]|nr:PKD domain-containing protein [Cytophagaceae bacterium]MDW8456878.1 PKD domain-containing protein [Cytophagaceae bacterium]
MELNRLEIMRFVFVTSFVILPALLIAQINAKAKKAFSEGEFEKAITLYEKDLAKLKKGSKAHQQTLYQLAEAYRMSGNYFMADSIHKSLDFKIVSYWGYALTLMQQYRTDKCLAFVNRELKFDPLHPELLAIKHACEQNLKKLDETKTIVTPQPLAQICGKPKAAANGFCIGSYNLEKPKPEVLKKLYSKERKTTDSSTSLYPLVCRGIKAKKKNGTLYSMVSKSKILYVVPELYFVYYLSKKTPQNAPGLLHEICINDPAIPYDSTGAKIPPVSNTLYITIDVKQKGEVVRYGCLSPDGRTMVISSNKLKGEGGYDLFILKLTDQGWSKPINLGLRVNTSKNEFHPFISSKNILYFASNGHLGHGGYDIYSFDLNNIDSAQTENLPKPYNSPYDDYAYLYHEGSGYGYFASNRPNGIVSGNVFCFENKLQNCDAKLFFAEIKPTRLKCDESLFCKNFDMSYLKDSINNSYQYIWDMGDGTKKKGLKFRHCYAQPGRYVATMYKIDPISKSIDTIGVTKKEIIIEERDYLVYEKSIKKDEVEFSAENSVCKKCEDVNYYWDFGDGNYGCGLHVKHRYKKPGTYKPRLLMTYRKDKEPRIQMCQDVFRLEF